MAFRTWQVRSSIREVLDRVECYVRVELDMKRIADLQLTLTATLVQRAILKAPKLKIKENNLVVESRSVLKVFIWI